MIVFLSLLPAFLGIAAAPDPDDFPRVRFSYVQQEVVVRVPVRPRAIPATAGWAEKRGPKCIKLRKIRGAVLSGTDHVDFVMANRRRIRAKLENNCPALDFYAGFYLNTPDEKICERRDAVRSRMGANCTITDFRNLVPVERRAIP